MIVRIRATGTERTEEGNPLHDLEGIFHVYFAKTAPNNIATGGGHHHGAVGIDLERNHELGNTAWSRGNARELEFSKKAVVLGQRTRTFTLEELDQDGGLVVGGSGEDPTLASVDDGVTRDELLP